MSTKKGQNTNLVFLSQPNSNHFKLSDFIFDNIFLLLLRMGATRTFTKYRFYKFFLTLFGSGLLSLEVCKLLTTKIFYLSLKALKRPDVSLIFSLIWIQYKIPRRLQSHPICGGKRLFLMGVSSWSISAII